jgi:hypothetical protein
MNGASVEHSTLAVEGAVLTLEELKTDPSFWPYTEPYCKCSADKCYLA